MYTDIQYLYILWNDHHCKSSLTSITTQWQFFFVVVKRIFRIYFQGSFLGVQWLRLCFHCRGRGFNSWLGKFACLESESSSVESKSDSLWPYGLGPARLLYPWNFSGNNTGMGSPSLLQGIFLTQESNQGLLHYRQILYQQNYQCSQREKKRKTICKL